MHKTDFTLSEKVGRSLRPSKYRLRRTHLQRTTR